MSDAYFKDERRVRAILLTGRNTIILVKRRNPEGEGSQKPYWVAPGGDVLPEDADEHAALKRELRTRLGADIHIENLAMQLFMSRWNFYICRLKSVDLGLRRWQTWRAEDNSIYMPQEFSLEESTLRKVNIQPRALTDYLMLNLDKLQSAR